jgi:GTPase SAR1 family protein
MPKLSFNLPLPNYLFTGRTSELNQLSRLCEEKFSAMIVLCGDEGVGKSTFF